MLKVVRQRFRQEESVNILGIRVDPTNMDLAVETVLRWVREGVGSCQYVCVTGVHGIVEAQADDGFREILNCANLNVPDGMPLTWLGWFAGFQAMNRVFGPDFMVRVCEDSAKYHISHFFYGGSEGVAEDLAARLQRRLPGLRVAGTFCPPFRPLTGDEQEKVVELINSSGAQIVWVGLSTPKQERWIAETHRRLNARVALGVGAAFDYNTGRLRRAPRWMQKSGLEWFYRLLQEPRRLWGRYTYTIPVFVILLALQLTTNRYAISSQSRPFPR